MRVYGLTGGTGSGKTEAARRFEAAGIPVLSADAIGHEAIAPGGGAEEAVRKAFGEGILTNGAIDREKLGGLVFADAEARANLNAIVHPVIHAELKRRCRELGAAGHPCVVIDAALIAEDGVREPCFSGIVLVMGSVETRVGRLTARRGLSRAEAERRVASQTPPEKKVALADWVVDNEGRLEEFLERIDAIIEEIRGCGA